MDFRAYATKTWTCAHCGHISPVDRSLAILEGTGMRLLMSCPRCDMPSITRIRGIFRIRVETEAIPPPELIPDSATPPDGATTVQLDLNAGDAGQSEALRRPQGSAEIAPPHAPGNEDAADEGGVKIDDLRRIASSKTDNGWLVSADIACFWTTVRQLHSDRHLHLDWLDSKEAAIAVYEAASTLVGGDRRPVPCFELGETALPDLGSHDSRRVARIALAEGLIAYDPAWAPERMELLENEDFGVTDGVGAASGWTVTHDAPRIFQAWKVLCATCVPSHQAADALWEIMLAAEFGQNGMGQPMSQRDILVWCIAQLPADLGDDRDARIEALRRGLGVADAKGVIWRHASA